MGITVSGQVRSSCKVKIVKPRFTVGAGLPSQYSAMSVTLMASIHTLDVNAAETRPIMNEPQKHPRRPDTTPSTSPKVSYTDTHTDSVDCC